MKKRNFSPGCSGILFCFAWISAWGNKKDIAENGLEYL